MKKHKNLLIMLVLASAFIGVLIWNNREIPPDPPPAPPVKGYTELTKQLDSLGQNPWDEKAYKFAQLTIGSSEMTNKISDAQMNNLLKVLEMKAANAMVISFDKWNSNDCGSVNRIKVLVAKMKLQSEKVNFPALANRIVQFNNFQSFLRLENSVNAIVKKEFDGNAVNVLLDKIAKSFDKEGVKDCSAMFNKKSEWITAMNKFKDIPGAFGQFMGPDYGRVNPQTCEDFRKYTFYHNELLKVKKCTN